MDIFFVISGFLMTKIVSERIDNDTFSLRNFYIERARRIIPALVFLCISLFILGWFILLPLDYSSLSKHVLSTLTFSSNVIYWKESGYFDASSLRKWLLHTWSLSVEWQFYLIYPIILYTLRKFLHKSTASIIVLIITALSLILSMLLSSKHQSASFYLLPTRAWEMFMGGLVYLFPLKTTEKLKRIILITGFSLIAISITILNRNVIWPGYLALLPTLGSSFVMASGKVSISLFKSRFITWLGKISYSLYLWHWPIVVLISKYNKLNNVSFILIGLISSFSLASISYIYIENKTRKININIFNARGFALPIIVTCYLLFLIPPFLAIKNIGFDYRFRENIVKMEKYVKYDFNDNMRVGQCLLTSKHNQMSFFNKEICLRLSSVKKNILLFGDSHAAHFWPGLSSNLPQFNILQATASGCLPLLHTMGESRCTTLRDYIFFNFLPKNKIDFIVLSARWQKEDIKHLPETIRELRKYSNHIYIFGPIVEYTRGLPELIAESMLQNDKFILINNRLTETEGLDMEISNLIRNTSAKYVSIYHALCKDNDNCITTTNQIPVQFDYGHLTKEGSTIVIKSIINSGVLIN